LQSSKPYKQYEVSAYKYVEFDCLHFWAFRESVLPFLKWALETACATLLKLRYVNAILDPPFWSFEWLRQVAA